MMDTEKNIMDQKDQTLKPATPTVDISRFDMRVGEVILVKEHPFDKKYFLVHVDISTNRRSTSRLAHLLVRQQVDRQRVVVLCNVRGMVQGTFSDCFIVYARSGSMAELLVPPGDADLGDRVYVPGYPFDPFQDWPYITPDKKGMKIFYEAAKDVKAGMNTGIVRYRGVPFRTVKEGDFRIKPHTLWKLRI